jgi:hypothetical protein
LVKFSVLLKGTAEDVSTNKVAKLLPRHAKAHWPGANVWDDLVQLHRWSFLQN